MKKRFVKKSILVLGYFAAVHIGHRSLFSLAESRAKVTGSSVTVVTFDDGIYRSLGRDFREIFVLREREEIIRQYGFSVDVLPSNREFLNLSYQDFLALLDKKSPLEIVVGADYRFGKTALGTTKELSDYFVARDVPVHVCELLTVDGEKISSSMIGRLLSEGEVERANAILGNPFYMSGVVQKGLGNGKKMGFPTANLNFDRDKFIPKEGVYATYVYCDGKRYLAMTNVGPHPTFSYRDVNAETHVFGLDKDLYGQFIKVEFIKYLRETNYFSCINDLKQQLEIDKRNALEVLS